MKIFSEGAEAKIYSTDVLGQPALVKVREAKAYRVKKLDEEIRSSRTKTEARTLQRAHKLGVRVPRILAVGKFSIYLEQLGGKLMRDSEHHAKTFVELGKMLGMMHNGNIIHGDFTPANVLLDGSRVALIDFGLAEVTVSIEEKALDLLLMKRSVDPKMYAAFEKSYASTCKNAAEIIERLAEVEKRGRYQVRTLV